MLTGLQLVVLIGERQVNGANGKHLMKVILILLTNFLILKSLLLSQK